MVDDMIEGIEVPKSKGKDVDVGATIDVTTFWDAQTRNYRIGVYDSGKIYDITDVALAALSLEGQRERVIHVSKGASSIGAALQASYENDFMYRVIDRAAEQDKNLFEFFSRCKELSTGDGLDYREMAVAPDEGTSGLTNAVRTRKAGGIGVSYMVSALNRTKDAAAAGIPTDEYERMAILTAKGEWCEFFPKADQAEHYAQPNGAFGISHAQFLNLDSGEYVPIFAASESELGVLFDMRKKQMVGYMPVDDVSFDVSEKANKLTLPIDKTFEGGMMAHSLLRIVEKPTDRVPLVKMRTSIYDPSGNEEFNQEFNTHDAVFGDTTGDGFMDYGVFFRTTAHLPSPRFMLVATGAGAIPPKEGEGRVLREGYRVQVGLDDMPDVVAVGKTIHPESLDEHPINPSLDRLLLESL